MKKSLLAVVIAIATILMFLVSSCELKKYDPPKAPKEFIKQKKQQKGLKDA